MAIRHPTGGWSLDTKWAPKGRRRLCVAPCLPESGWSQDTRQAPTAGRRLHAAVTPQVAAITYLQHLTQSSTGRPGRQVREELGDSSVGDRHSVRNRLVTVHTIQSVIA